MFLWNDMPDFQWWTNSPDFMVNITVIFAEFDGKYHRDLNGIFIQQIV